MWEQPLAAILLLWGADRDLKVAPTGCFEQDE